MNKQLKYYKGTVPCCGVFCGGCSFYTRPKPTCGGASTRCVERKCGFYKCCVEKKGLQFCFECKTFPCSRFKKFAETWLKLGQDLIENQQLLSKSGIDNFLKYYNSKLNPNNMFNIRQASTSDIPELKELYQNTVLTVNRKDYYAEEVEDWASCGDDLPHWSELFAEQHYIVAENDKKEIVGFASINDTGYMHTLFVHKDFQHQGIATLLYQAIEKYAKEKGVEKITSEISITARPFFEKQGFVIDEEQKRKANKLYLTNYKMSKILHKPLAEMTSEELWQLFPIVLVEHQAHWKNDFQQEEKMLKEKIGNEHIERISHIGSTAIPELLAKPTIDILLEIKEKTDPSNLITIMESIGYIYSPQPHNPEPHMMFMKGYTPTGFQPPVFHVHVRYLGDWDEIYFRDYLLKHPETAKEYAELKLKLKEQFEHDRDGYTAAKTEFVQRITNLAKQK